MKPDKVTLEILYHDKNMSLSEIGEIYNKTGSTMLYYVKKWNIPPKSRSRYGKNFSSELLYDLYIRKDLKVSEVARELHSNSITISKYLKEAGIEIKGIKHYNKHPPVEFTKEQYDFFDGLMFSDGSLVRAKSGGRIRNAKISCGFKYKSFAKYIDKYLNLDGNVHKKIHTSERYKKGFCVQYGLMSKNNTVFTEEHKRWYPDGKKKIPDDFRFSAVSMNIAYLGDGHLSKSGKHITIHTESFNKKNIEDTIIKKLIDIGIKCHVTTNNIIFIPKSSAKNFLVYIGECPIGCYKYKWRY